MTCHDSGDGRWDSPAEELEGVVGDLFGGGPVLALGSGGDHARLEEDALEEDVVLSEVEEHLGPHRLSDLKSPVDPVLAVQHDLRLHNRDQPVVLRTKHKL